MKRAWTVALNARYPDHYCWYILAATLDIVTTFIVIEEYRGWEANKLAAALFDRFGWPGMIVFKYMTVLIVIAVCETVGRSRPELGRRLATAAVVISALPMLLGAAQIWAWAGRGGHEAHARGAGACLREHAAAAEQGLEGLAEDEVVLGELHARHVLVEVAEHEVDCADGACARGA
jgi:hypothetical protein